MSLLSYAERDIENPTTHFTLNIFLILATL